MLYKYLLYERAPTTLIIFEENLNQNFPGLNSSLENETFMTQISLIKVALFITCYIWGLLLVLTLNDVFK